MSNIWILIAAGAAMFIVIGGLSLLSHHYTLNGIKSRTVGDGQHGTARWATDKEIKETFAHVPFDVNGWRHGHGLDTKGDLARNYGTIAKKYYGYNVSVIDLRNPTRSDGNNLLTLVNRYMDIAREEPDNLAARAKAEKYAKILAKTIVNPEGDASNYGQNAFFVRP